MFSISSEKFFEYAPELFSRTGHTDVNAPEFANHSARQFVYFDNVSRLFTVCGIAFFSANLLVSRSDRSQAAHDVHS